MNWLRTRRARAPRPRTAPSARPALEALEAREVPTVTYHGGPLLQHVQVQSLFYGSDWYNNRTYYNQTGQIEGYERYLVNSPYMDMLTNAGYNVGRGSLTQGKIYLANINKGYYLDDTTIHNNLLALIRNGSLQPNNGNRLYVIFVEPGVAVSVNGEKSTRD